MRERKKETDEEIDSEGGQRQVGKRRGRGNEKQSEKFRERKRPRRQETFREKEHQRERDGDGQVRGTDSRPSDAAPALPCYTCVYFKNWKNRALCHSFHSAPPPSATSAVMSGYIKQKNAFRLNYLDNCPPSRSLRHVDFLAFVQGGRQGRAN